MKRKIVALNLVLAAVVAFAGVQLRNQWRAARNRERAVLAAPSVKPPQVPPYIPLPGSEPALSASYNNIVQKDLLDPSRNPNVVIEVVPPPPPPPMPALPRYHGQMNLDGVTAILSDNANAPQRSVHLGEQIGEFKLVDVSTEELVFQWNGQTVRKRIEELSDRSEPGSNVPVRSAMQAPPPPVPVIKTPLGPGEMMPQGFRVCNPNDSTPDGAVVDGFRKVSYSTPFGSACRWDPIGK